MSRSQLAHDGAAADLGEETLESLDETVVHEVLSNERRRRVLGLLREDAPRELSVLAEEIATAETDQRPPPRNKRNSVYVTLHQTHLPKLDRLDVVAYDDREKVVDLGPRAEDVLESSGDSSDHGAGDSSSWTAAYATLVALGLSVAGASEFGLPPFEAVSSGTAAVATLVVLMAVLAYRVGAAGVGLPASFFERFR
ncbi:DUF7344 domain-containing protein [Halorientalis halophila]|uniref:DUF7344 domain-containing protein n=1 Tax=Halorientalis halophila TaxID=3108499 RepID=UPI00300A3AC7